MATPPRDARGRFTSGGGESVGGIEATVSVDTQAFTPAIERILADLNRVEAKFAKTATAGSSVAVGMNGVAVGGMGAAQKMVILGQAMDDVQYGFSAIVNQSGQIAAALGLGAGVGGAAMVAGVAINQLIKHWDDITAAFGASKTLTAAEEMEHLAKATNRTAAETERLNQLKKEARQDEQQRAARPEAEGKAGAAFGKALAEAPLEDIEPIIRRALRPAARPVTDEDVEAVIGPERESALRASRGASGLAAGRAEEVRKQLENERFREADRLASEEARRILRESQFGEGTAGEAARARVAKILGSAPDTPADTKADILAALEGGAVGSEARKKARKALEEQVEKDVAEEEERTAKEVEEFRDFRLGGKFEAGGRQAADEQAAAKAGEAAHEEAMDALEEEKRRNKEREDANEKANRQFFRDEKDRERDEEDRERLEEKGSDLNWRLFDLMKPERPGQSMGLDAYEASIKSGGEDRVEKKLHAINEVLEDIRDNEKKMKLIGVKRR